MSSDQLVIDTEIKGWQFDIRELGEALGVLATAVDDGQFEVIAARTLHQGMAAGDFAARFDEWIAKLTVMFGQGGDLASRAADVCVAYADQLDWAQREDVGLPR